MIASLGDAWRWYESVRDLTRSIGRLGERYWGELPWDGALGRDDRLRHLEAVEILDRSRVVLDDLDDLCVLLMFSVFESIIRERTLQDIAAELPAFEHPALMRAVRDLQDTVGQGSFSRVIADYKGLDADLIEEVNQVRSYRNWVAHGR